MKDDVIASNRIKIRNIFSAVKRILFFLMRNLMNEKFEQIFKLRL